MNNNEPVIMSPNEEPMHPNEEPTANQFQNFIKGKYNQGRKNLLSNFLRKKCKILLRYKICKPKAKKEKVEPHLKNEKPLDFVDLDFIDVYSKLYKIFEDYYRKNKHSISLKTSTKNPQKKPYSLAEDVKLFLVIHMSNNRSSYDQSFSISFENIVKEWGFVRSIESLRDRYKRFLKKMTVSDWEIVLKHIEFHNLEGVLQFLGPKNNKKFERVDDGLKQNISNYKQSEEKKALKSNIKRESVKKEELEEIKSLKLKLKRETIKEEEEIIEKGQVFFGKEKELNKILEALNHDLDKSKEELIKTLDEVSGNVDELKEVYKNKKDTLLWSEEDDKILREAQSVEDVGFKVLLRYKGENNIKRRIKYRNYTLGFKWE